VIRVSTKGRYGTRLMLNLAHHYNSGHKAIILKSIAAEEDISLRYLEQIIIPLKIYKLVKSIRGAGGGYTLSRKPSDISICQVLEALEGSCGLVDCVDDKDFCDRVPNCAAYDIWRDASQLLKDYFKSLTLQSVLDTWDKKSKAKSKSRR
jgi:Rrf2 family protein